MIKNLRDISILPKMAEKKGRTYTLLWATDLHYLPGHCSISLLFKNIEGDFYITDSIPPELLSYCTIGSFFKEGKKLENMPPTGDILRFTISSTAHNRIVLAKDAITDAEYPLTFPTTGDNATFLFNITEFCKHQHCLVFQSEGLKIVIPSFVIGGTYYFKSTSMREQVFSQKLEGLYEWIKIDSETKNAEILLKPGASDQDASDIVRFATNGFARNRWDMIMNYIRKRNGQYNPLKVDLPVQQDISILARGNFSENPEGGKTFVVFEILEENSRFPFDTISLLRRRYDSSGRDLMTISVSDSKDSDRMTHSSPAAREIQKILKERVRISNPNEKAIVKTKTYIEPDPRGKKEYLIVGVKREGEVDLSAQQEKNSAKKISKAKIERNQEETVAGYEMSLDEFVQMASELKEMEGITGWSYSEQLVWQKPRYNGKKRLSQKESYDGTEGNRRRCGYVSFQHQWKQVCLVEIDQRGLPNGCSTFVLCSAEHEAVAEADKVVKWYVEAVTQEKISARLAKVGVVFQVKHHPSSNSEADRSSWISRLLTILS